VTSADQAGSAMAATAIDANAASKFLSVMASLPIFCGLRTAALRSGYTPHPWARKGGATCSDGRAFFGGGGCASR
jgi:hypothetical protein